MATAANVAARLRLSSLNKQQLTLTASHPTKYIRHFSVATVGRKRWGFIGLGAMGYPMATTLRRRIPRDDHLVVFDKCLDLGQKFADEINGTSTEAARGAREVAETSNLPLDVLLLISYQILIANPLTAKELLPSNVSCWKSCGLISEQKDIIFTVLPEPQHISSVFQTMLASPLPASRNEGARLFIDCSTIDPVTSREVAASVRQSAPSGASCFVDAPMSGGVVGARAGTLTFMVGCDDPVFPWVENALKLMGEKIWYLGPQGAGVSAKLANNYALAINNIAAAEAMNLGLKWGLDPKSLANLINSSTGRSWPSEVNNPVPGVVPTAPASRDYQGGFGVSLMRKDLRLAMAAAEAAGAQLKLAPTATNVYEQVERSNAGKDFSSVYQWLSRQKDAK